MENKAVYGSSIGVSVGVGGGNIRRARRGCTAGISFLASETYNVIQIETSLIAVTHIKSTRPACQLLLSPHFFFLSTFTSEGD
jgi:hypothetical protein